MRPTFRAVLLFAASVPVALVIVTAWAEFWYASLYLPATALALLAADVVMAMPRRRLRADVETPARLSVGQTGAVAVQLSCTQSDRSLRIQALLELAGEVAPPVLLSGAMEKGLLALTLPIVPGRRGRVTVDALWLRWRGLLGLVELRRRDPVDRNIDVVPDVKGIHETALQFYSRSTLHGVKTQRQRGEGTEFESLRDYAPGMDNRLIDWKRSARHRKLLGKEFRQERNHQIVFGFDTGRLMLESIDGIPKLDHAIRAGLMLSWVSLRSGDLVGGFGFDARFRHFLKPGRGMPYFTQFQRFSSALEYRPEETNFTLGLAELNTRLTRRALVVLFTDFVDQISAELLLESLRWMVRRHLVIFVTLRDPLLSRLQDAPPENFSEMAEAVIASDMLRERRIVLERIVRLGVHCLDAPASGVSSALLNRYLIIKQRGLL